MIPLVLIVMLWASCSHAYSVNEVKEKIIASAIKHGIDPDLAVAVGKTESSLKWNAVGMHGEVGPLQRLFPDGKGDVNNLNQNIEAGILYLKEAKDKCAFYPDFSWVNCYNLGVNYKRLKHPKKYKYYVKVMKHLNSIKYKRYLAQK